MIVLSAVAFLPPGEPLPRHPRSRLRPPARYRRIAIALASGAGHAELEIADDCVELRADGRDMAKRRADIGSATTATTPARSVSVGIVRPAIRPRTTRINGTFIAPKRRSRRQSRVRCRVRGRAR